MGKGSKTKKKHSSRPSSKKTLPAAKFVSHWALHAGTAGNSSSNGQALGLEDWLRDATSCGEAPVFDLHTHSTCSDGMLSPQQLVEKAATSGVRVLALTDHDSMEGVPMAIERASKLGIRLIPGVEISAKSGARMKSGFEESVHILGYYSCCGPSRWTELEKALSNIREGRYQRAESIINKLKMLKVPVCWEQVLSLAGDGVAPGRMHVARALVEAGHVGTIKEAFDKYLHDGGPAYAVGYELASEDAVRLVCNTGGIAALAHPWTLKDPLSTVKRLKAAGLHAMEVYRGDGKATGYADMAVAFGLVKLGGSDYHGRGDPNETKLGKVPLPLLTISEFLSVGGPLWSNAIKELLQCFAQETFEVQSKKIVGLKYLFGLQSLKGDTLLEYFLEGEKQMASLRLSAWLTEEERLAVEQEVSQLGLKYETLTENGKISVRVTREIC